MKKKILSVVAAIMLASVSTFALEQIPLSVNYDDTGSAIPGIGKGPIMPSLWQDGYELTFLSSHDDYTLELRQGGVVVYSTFVSSSTSTIVLPSTLQGEYKIRLYGDESYYLFGYITL